MPKQQIRAIVLSLFLGLTVTLVYAKRPTLHRDSIKKVTVKNPIKVKRIDTLSLSPKEEELASSAIREMLADQMSPLRKMIKDNRNAYVKEYINKYTNPSYRSHLSKMKGLASYYFPIFEKVFKEMNVPVDVKYLAIVESSLNPHAVSRAGATGPWQFMYATAKGYGLQINSYVDERKDPIEATYAAARYLKDAYNTYGDWFLAIASYNCGKGNVNRAIQRSGKSNPSFWDIRPYLPNETRNYVPAFIALTHILDNEGLYPIEANYNDMPKEIDVVFIDRNMSLASIAKVMEVQPNDLYKLNPSYKRKVINGTKVNPGRLIVPKIPKSDYVKVYNFLQGNQAGPTVLSAKNTREPKKQSLTAATQSEVTAKAPKDNFYIAYKVKKGDTLDAITKQFKGSTVASLKAMNNLQSDIIQPGMTLKINQD